MKILHVETGRHLYGGPQQVVYLLGGLVGRGHDCTLVCPPASGIDTAARKNGISVRNLFCAGDLDLPFAYRLTQYINETKPDLVHCHSRRGADILGGLAASFADVPAVVSRRVDNPEIQMLAALRYRPFKKVIAISEAIADVLRGIGIDDERLTVIRSAVDAAAFAATPDRQAFSAEFDIPDEAFVVGAAGQLIARKGHRYLLEAVAAARAGLPDLRVLIFGEGELEQALKDRAASLGIDDIVQFVGFREDLDHWIGCFDLFAHPALAEGLGVVLLKAQAAGVPVLGFRTGGVPEAVVSGETGLLVEPEDIPAMTAALTRLVKNDELRAKFGVAGRKRVREEFTVAEMVDKHEALYESLTHE